MNSKNKKIVTIGGGTGSFTLLSGLKHYPVELSAIVSMADDGGSTGVLRDELGVLPPGDVRQCLVALSGSSELMRDLINYRFANGRLNGHSFGNLLLSALEKVTGCFEKAIDEVGKILLIKGKVIPVTTVETRLKMILDNGHVLQGEGEIYISKKIDMGFKQLFLEPSVKANEKAVNEIISADTIVLGPGGLYTSLIPNLLVDGINRALIEAKAKKIFVINLMNKKGQTSDYKASDYLKEMIKYISKDVFDFILINNIKPSEELIKAYFKEAELIINDIKDKRVILADILKNEKAEYNSNDALASYRALIRHDPHKIAKIIYNL